MRNFKIIMSNIILIALFFESVLCSVSHHDETSSSLTRIVYDKTSNRIIVAGLNAIFMFDGLLQRLQMVETGPLLSGNCSSNDRWTPCGKQDNQPKILLLTPDGRHLLYCGSNKKGSCFIYDSQNLNFNQELSLSNLYFLGNSKNIAAMFSSSGSLFLGKSFDDLNVDKSFALSNFILKEDTTTRELTLSYSCDDEGNPELCSIRFSETIKPYFIVNYVDVFEHQGFLYFLTVQRESETDDTYHSKLVRVCKDEKVLHSYSELELSCTKKDFITQSHVSFNIASAAHLSRVATVTGQKLGLGPENDVLFVAMTKGQPNSLEAEESVVCAFPMRSVQKEFVKLQRDCYSGIGRILPWIDDSEPKCKVNIDVAKNIDNKFCGHHLNVGMGSRYPLHSDPLYHLTQSLTAVKVVTINNRTVALLRTEKGFLLKVVLDDPDPIPYSTIYLNSGGGQDTHVSSSMVLDPSEQNLFVLSGNRISKVSLKSCDEYTECVTCIAGHDPNSCGWCGDHCSSADQCPSSSRWQNDSCSPIIYSFTPKKGPFYGNTLVEIHGDNFGHPSPDVKASVTIGNASCSIKFRNNSYILCKTSPYQANYERELNISIEDDLKILMPYNIEGHDTTEGEHFAFKHPCINSISPSIGPFSGGTNVTISGKNLNIGSSLSVYIGGECSIINISSDQIICSTPYFSPSLSSLTTKAATESAVRVQVIIDGTDIGNTTFSFLRDPVVSRVNPRQSLISGGQMLTVEGSNLNIIQNPKLCVAVHNYQSCSDVCRVNKSNFEQIICPSPSILSGLNLYDDDLEVSGEMDFIMDGVKDAWKKSKATPSNKKDRMLRYYQDPRFNSVNKDSFMSPNVLKLGGSHLNLSARAEDYIIKVDGYACNVTHLTNDMLLCKLPRRFLVPNHYIVTIQLGHFQFKSELNPLRSEQLQSSSFAYPHLFWIFLAAIIVVLVFTLTIYTAWVRSLTKAKEEKRSRTIPNVFYERTPRRFTRSSRTEIFNIEEAYNSVAPSAADANRNNRHLSNTYWSQTSSGRPSRQSVPTLPQNVISLIDDRTKQLLRDMNLIIPRNKLTLMGSIGQGHFGCVYRGNLQDDAKSCVREVAVKTLKNSPDIIFQTSDCKKFIEEAMTMQEFNHTHVLSLIGIIVEGGDGVGGEGEIPMTMGLPMVVLPFMKHGDLLSYIRNEQNMPTVKNLMDFGIQIGRGMSYLSNLKFVHRDLAARNCMLDDDMLVKVADFGLSRDIYEREYYSSGDRKTALPIKWMAIESLEKGIYSTKSDVWSFGVVLWELLTRGVSPYMEVDSWDILKFLKHGRRLVQPAYCPPALYRLMKKCWYSDPSLRPTFDELVTYIENIIAKMEKRGTEEQVTTRNNYINITNNDCDDTYPNPNNQGSDDDEDGYLRPLDNIDCSSLSTEHLQLVADLDSR